MPSQSSAKQSTDLVLIVQLIETTWTKASRGGQGASVRNSVPEQIRLALPAVGSRSFTTLYHDLIYDERADFVQPTSTIQLDPIQVPRTGCCSIDRTTTSATVRYRYQRTNGGAPDRGWLQHTLRVEPEQWVQVRENGRFAPGWDGDWWYHKVVVNVGLFAQVHPDVFVQAPPIAQFDALAQLW